MQRGPLLALVFSAIVCAGIIVAATMKKPSDQPMPPVEVASGGAALVKYAPASAPAGMVWIPGGSFMMGGQDELAQKKPNELPVHEVELDGFYMDETEVTNAEYARFVEATGHVTYAEERRSREDFEGMVPDISLIADQDLEPGSICFNPNFDESSIDKSDPAWPLKVWQVVRGADWRHPFGPDSSIEGQMDHPVAHVNYDDVMAYCKWAGKRLPTEAEWEYAARGGLKGKSFPWGNDREPDEKWVFNMWQGTFPEKYREDYNDGYRHSSPVKTFAPNGYGLYDMSGNMWEWTSDFYRPDYYFDSPKRNPQGPETSFDPMEPQIVKRVQRGGSFMCNENYCLGYRVSSRMNGDVLTGSFHCGFRCVIGHDELEKYRNAPRQKQATAADRKTAAK